LETAIGVFSSRGRAEEAVKQLRQQGIPEEEIVFLTRSEHEAKATARGLAGRVGGLAGGAADVSVAVAEFLLPGMGTVFAIGFGRVTLLRLAAVRAASAVGLHVVDGEKVPGPVADEKSPEKSKDAAFFCEVLQDGRSLVVVRTESKELVTLACAILDLLGMGLQEKTTTELQITTRQVGEAAIIEISGRITVGEGNLALREVVRTLVESGEKNIVLNLGKVSYMDSSGLGELVKTHTTIRKSEGELKLVNLSKRVDELLEMTKLSSVFDIYEDEASAIDSFGRHSLRQATA
jgi:anti-sigma B factor antagonist